MLRTLVRALLTFVVLCLVSAARPAPRPVYDDPSEARLDVAKSRVELVAPRRDGQLRERDPRDPRDLAFTLPPAPFSHVVPPLRSSWIVGATARSRTSVPVVFARSSRGPPVG